MRERGYYWVRVTHIREWQIEYWLGNKWDWPPNDYKNFERRILEIDENRITREPGVFHFSTKPITIKGEDLIAKSEQKSNGGDKLFGLL